MTGKLIAVALSMLLMVGGVALLVYGVTVEQWGYVPGAALAAYFGARSLEQMSL